MRLFLLTAATALTLSSAASATTFTQLDVFGDSTVDSGWWAGALASQCGPVTGPCDAEGKTGSIQDHTFDTKVADAIKAGGTGAPVGVGQMNTQYLASMLGLTAAPANQPGGTNYAISGSKDATSGGLGNLHANPNLPSTLQQMALYLAQNGGKASPTALYLISSGGNDITYANNNFNDPTDKQNYLTVQITALVAAIQNLQAEGAQHFLINNLYGNSSPNSLVSFYNTTLVNALKAAGISYILGDINTLVQNVEANPSAYNLLTAQPGIAGDSNTPSACVAGANASGWGQFCGNTTQPQSNFSHLRTSNSEETSFFSDDQHFSDAGQLIEAQYEFGLLNTAAVPELSTWSMMILRFCGLGVLAYRRRNHAAALAAG